MTHAKKPMVPHLLLIDPATQCSATLLHALHASPLLTLAVQPDLPPTAVLLVVGVGELPSRSIFRYRATMKDVPLIVYDPMPTIGRQANTFNAGVGGYIIDGTTIADLLPVIEVARRGGFGLCRAAFERLKAGLPLPSIFSERDRKVLTLMTFEATSAAIANELHITEEEVDAHLRAARQKVGVDSNVALATWWTHWTLNDDFTEDDEAQDITSLVSLVISA